MDNKTIELISQFLARVDLKGSEVSAFNSVQQALATDYEANKNATEIKKSKKEA